MFLHRFAERAEDDALFGELFLESRADRNAIKHRVHRHARQPPAFAQRNAELLVSLQQLRINFVQALRPVPFCFGAE